MSDRKADLRKALKSLYDDLLEAENGPDRNTFGFQHRLKVIHENLEEMIPRLLAEFPHLGELSAFGDFEQEYDRRGDSGMDQLLKSEIKKLAIETDTDLEQDFIDDSKKDKKRALTPAQKTWMWENKSRICIICKKEVKKQSDAHYDHIKPHVKGEKTVPAKMAITHALCNRLKGKKSLRQIQKELGTLSKVKIKKTDRKSIANNIDKTLFDFTLEKFFENKKEYVRIRNSGRTIESITILCKKERCNWWDNNTTLPRHIYAGGGGNVLLPHYIKNTDPVITVMSGKKTIRKMKLSDIVLTHP